jgi:hypothetical protein
MRPSDKPKFVTTLVGLAAIKNRELTGEAIDLWWLSMAKWSIEDFTSAAAHLVTECQFMPTPYDFAQLRKAGELTAGEAWERVLGGAKLELGSRAYRAAQIVGGQVAIRHADIERDLPFIQKRFMEAYGDLSDVDSVREALPQIANIDVLPALPSGRGGFARIGSVS